MTFESKLKEDILKGDYRNEAEDTYVKMIEAGTKKNKIVKIGIGLMYILLLLTSLFIV